MPMSKERIAEIKEYHESAKRWYGPSAEVVKILDDLLAAIIREEIAKPIPALLAEVRRLRADNAAMANQLAAEASECMRLRAELDAAKKAIERWNNWLKQDTPSKSKMEIES